jgi:ferredoxin-NADP reductase
MAGTAILGRLNWLEAKVVSKRIETPRVCSIVFECPMWDGHMAGQHVDVRLTAEDGYQAQRSYSIASAPEDDHLVLTIERLQDGEVSPYLFDVVEPGDELELRGPIGRFFVWEAGMTGPVQMIAGGSGVVPFRAMIRHRLAAGDDSSFRLLYSARALDDVIFREELAGYGEDGGLELTLTLTREHPEGWDGYDRRIDASMLREVALEPSPEASIFVCGPTPFVEVAANCLLDLGHDPGSVKTERFGATG